MGNLGRKRKGKQHVAKVTPTIRRKQQTIGASSTKMKQHIATQRKVDDWVQNMTKIATDAGILPKKGTAYGEGEAVIIVRIVYNMVKRRAKALKWGNKRKAPQLQEVFEDAAGLMDMSVDVVRELFEDFMKNETITIKDTASRGRGSVNAEPRRLRTNEQYAAIEAFVDYCNSKKGGGKCTLEQIQLYMEDGPRPGSDDPPLDSGHRVRIPRSSLAYLLKKHLGYGFNYVNNHTVGSGTMDTKKRHAKIRKFAIEISRALKLQEGGEFVIAFTDESYVNQNHVPGATWLHGDKKVERPSGKGKRLVILHAITTGDFLCEYMDGGKGIEEGRYGGDGVSMVSRNTAEWIWPAKEAKGDYHDQMKGEGFESWLKHRLIPAFENNPKYADKKLILVMDNASYHHEMNRDYYPAGIEMSACSKAWHAHVLRKAGCSQIAVKRGNLTRWYEVPADEPAGFKEQRESKGKAPTGAFAGTVYERATKAGSGGPSGGELLGATKKWLKANKPEALESLVELLFRDKGWKIVWTPPYCPKFQPIELVWGVGKQRVSWSYTGKRTLAETHSQLRVGFYGGALGDGHHQRHYEKVNIAGCWKKAKGEIDRWISMDREHVGESGLGGSLDDLQGIENWTDSDDRCLDIEDYKGDLGEVILEDPEGSHDDDDDAYHGAAVAELVN
jgi:hypothetical protein